MEARETTATFSVITRRGRHCTGVPAKKQRRNEQVAGLGNTPRQNRNRTRGAIFAARVVSATNMKRPSRITRSFKNHGTQAEKEIPHQKDSWIQSGDYRIIISISILQHLVSQIVHRKLQSSAAFLSVYA